MMYSQQTTATTTPATHSSQIMTMYAFILWDLVHDRYVCRNPLVAEKMARDMVKPQRKLDRMTSVRRSSGVVYHGGTKVPGISTV